MISRIQTISTAKVALTFSVLNKFEAVNRFVNWATHGTVNRTTLAERLLRQAVDLGAEYAVENKMLGERSAVLLPLVQTIRGLQVADGRCVDLGGYQVGETFAKQIKTLDLGLPASALGYADTSLEIGKALWNAGWNSLGYSGGLDMQDSSVLKQLYNTCGQNADVMREVTRYLDATLAESAIGGPLLRTMAASEPGLLMIDDQRIKLDLDSPPRVQFTVRQVDPFVQVGIDVQYNVAAYGTEDDMRQPRGEQDSTVGASASIHVTPRAGQSSPATDIYHMGKLVSIFNQMAFDRNTGALQ